MTYKNFCCMLNLVWELILGTDSQVLLYKSVKNLFYHCLQQNVGDLRSSLTYFSDHAFFCKLILNFLEIITKTPICFNLQKKKKPIKILPSTLQEIVLKLISHIFFFYLINKRPMGHIAHTRNQFKSINTYNYIISLIKRRKY